MTRRTKPRVPSYRLHKPSGRAVVRLDGRDVYLGKYGTPESQTAYHRVIAEWSASCRPVHRDSTSPARPDLTVNEIAVPYWRFAQEYYRKNGDATSEAFSIKRALGPLVELYGTTPVSQFGPLALKTYRETLIVKGLTRGVINNHVGRVKRMFKWATENELVPAGVHHALQAVGGLRRGRSAAKETQPIRPVDDRARQPARGRDDPASTSDGDASRALAHSPRRTH